MNVAVAGATGQMGGAVTELAVEREDITVAFGIGRDPQARRNARVRV
jgi:dihydrodipicolinate reductase